MKTAKLKPCIPLYRLTSAINWDVVPSRVLISQAAVQEFKATETGAASAVQSVIRESPNRSTLVKQVGLKCQHSYSWSVAQYRKACPLGYAPL